MNSLSSSKSYGTSSQIAQGGNSTPQRSVGTLIRSMAGILVVAILTGALVMVLAESIAEVQRRMSAAAIGGLWDLIVAIFLTMINLIAGGAPAAYQGGMIGLYVGAAIAIAYLILTLLSVRRRWPVALILAAAGAAAAAYAVNGLGDRYLFGFCGGAALFGALTGLLLTRSQDQPTDKTMGGSSATQAGALMMMIVGLPALWLFVISPLTEEMRLATTLLDNVAGAQMLTPATSGSVVELAHLDANEVTQALFFPNGKSVAVAQSDGVVIYDATNWTVQRTIASGPSRRIAIAPNGEMIATAAGNDAKLWQVSDGQLLNTLQGHSNQVEDVAFSPDSTVVATASMDRTTRLWRVSNGQLLYTLDHLGRLFSVAYRFDGQVLATGSGAGTTLWNPLSGNRLRIVDVALANVNQIAFSPDGLTLAAAMSSGTVRFHNGDNYIESYVVPGNQALNTLAFSPDGQLLAYAGNDQLIHLWDVANHTPLASLSGHEGAINSVAFSPDGRLLVSTSLDGTLRIWGSATGAPATVQATTEALTATLPLTPTAGPMVIPSMTAAATAVQTPTRVLVGPPMATPTEQPTSNGASPLVPDVVGQMVEESTAPVGSLADLAYAPDGKHLAVAANQQVLILESGTLSQVSTINTPATALAYSPDGASLLTANGSVATLWRVADGQKIRDFELHGDAITDVAFSPDGASVATASLDHFTRIWRVSDGALLVPFSHFGAVQSLAFSPDGANLTTGSTVGIEQWRVSDGVRLRVLSLFSYRANRLVYSPDGQNLVAGMEDGKLWLWRQGGAGPSLLLAGHTGPIRDAAFSPDGQLLASASQDGTVRLWRVSDGAALRTLNTGAANAVAFSPDGTTLLIGLADGTLQRWGMSAPEATAIATPSSTSVQSEPEMVAVTDKDWQLWIR